MSASNQKICIESDPRVRRVGASTMWVAIAIGLVFVGLWLMVSVATLPYNIYWSCVIASAAIAFGFLLGYMSFTMIRDSKRRYLLELTDSEAALFVVDPIAKKKSTQMVLLDDISYAEYYPYRDSSAVILHTSYAKMEIPLWPLGRQGQDVIDFLDGRGVNVVNVQSDDKIPEITV